MLLPYLDRLREDLPVDGGVLSVRFDARAAGTLGSIGFDEAGSSPTTSERMRLPTSPRTSPNRLMATNGH